MCRRSGLCRRGRKQADVVAARGNQVCADDNDMDIAAAVVVWLFPGLPQRAVVAHTATKAKLRSGDSLLVVSRVDPGQKIKWTLSHAVGLMRSRQ